MYRNRLSPTSACRAAAGGERSTVHTTLGQSARTCGEVLAQRVEFLEIWIKLSLSEMRGQQYILRLMGVECLLRLCRTWQKLLVPPGHLALDRVVLTGSRYCRYDPRLACVPSLSARPTGYLSTGLRLDPQAAEEAHLREDKLANSTSQRQSVERVSQRTPTAVASPTLATDAFETSITI